MRGCNSGFTLIEVAIVLVILGLLVGGVLKGQELIAGARVHNLIAQQTGIKVAFFGFQDRYRALAGDYRFATQNIPVPPATATAMVASRRSEPRRRTCWSGIISPRPGC